MRWQGFIAVLMVSVVFGSCSFRDITSDTYNRYAEEGPYDVIIVPGIPYDSGHPSMLFKARMFWAKQLYDRGLARNIIFSGAAVHTPYIESKVMKLYANAMGIPSANTFIEIRATHSNENVFYGYKMARQLGFKKIALATDPFQSFCYGLFSKVYAADLGRLPASIDSLAAYSDRFADIKIDPSSAYIMNFVPVEKNRSSANNLKDSFGKLTRVEDVQ